MLWLTHRKIPKHRVKIGARARKATGVEDVYWDMTDEEVAIVAQKFSDVRLKEESEEIARTIEEEGTKCPECGCSLVHALSYGINVMGPGKTYAQRKMWPFTISYDVVCSKCGLVIRQATHEVHR